MDSALRAQAVMGGRMIAHTRNMAVEAVKWTGMNHEELISAFNTENFGYNEDVYAGEAHAYPGDYLVKAGDEVIVFSEKQFKAVFTEEER